MHFEQIYLDCLAQASYLIGSDGIGAVVDPRRDIDVYVEKARAEGLAIRHVIATHVHADFVAGLRELAAATGATIHMGRRFDGELECELIGDGDEIAFGSVTIRALETPGHTPESICLLVQDDDEPDGAPKLLTGDTLFIGDVGRPDLAGSLGYTPERMAGLMYDSVCEKIAPLDDDVEIWPGHGAGSACGRNISTQTCSTLGAQRISNWALAARPKAEFVRMMVENLGTPPSYFQHAATLNRRGPTLATELPPVRELDRDEFQAGLENGAIALDVRSAAEYGAGHLPGALNIGLCGMFASWAGTLIDARRNILVIAADRDQAEEATMRLRRVGLDDALGFRLAGGVASAGTLPQIQPAELRERLERARDEWQVIDVRRPGEYERGHVADAHAAPLDRLGRGEIELALDRSRATAVICGSGYRSSAAAHFLAHHGFERLHNVAGGTTAWLAAGYETVPG